MPELRGDDVVSAVSKNIRQRFSKARLKALYKDLPQQNIQKPYAFIHQVSAQHKNERGNRATWTFILDIRVHPQDNQTDINVWAREMSMDIIEAINIITVSDQAVKAQSIEYKVEDKVLHCIVSYSFKVLHIEDNAPDMQNLLYGEHLK